MTAAPRMIRASTVCSRPRSWNTRAVMPTLVAHRVAPTKACTYTPCPGNSQALAAQPSPKGVMTPSVATSSDGAPTFSICPTVDFSPISKSRTSTPRRASMSSEGLAHSGSRAEKPTSDRLPTTTPASSSPRTAGCPRRTASSPPSLATDSTMTSASAKAATGSAWSVPCEARAAVGRKMAAVSSRRRMEIASIPELPFGGGIRRAVAPAAPRETRECRRRG